MSEATLEQRPSGGMQAFSMGRIVSTPGALAALEAAGHNASEFLVRHALGDWGDLCDEDKQANDEAVADDLRILSAYRLQGRLQGGSNRIWIITEADRSVTTILLPEEY